MSEKNKQEQKQEEKNETKKSCPVCGEELTQKSNAIDGKSVWYCSTRSGYVGEYNILGACALFGKNLTEGDIDESGYKKYLPQNEEEAIKFTFAR